MWVDDIKLAEVCAVLAANVPCRCCPISTICPTGETDIGCARYFKCWITDSKIAVE